MKTSVCILDYGSGNVKSVLNIFSALVPEVVLSNSEEAILSATHVVLPGVGAFGASMEKIRKTIPLSILKEEVVGKGKPFLGICVGMQVLAQKGYEFGEHEGLGWIPGSVEKLNSGGMPLPHIGWNNVQTVRPSPLLARFDDNQDFYFVHSFIFKTEPENIVATSSYGEDFCSVVNRQNIYGVQFHPEKSQKAGKIMIENFLGLS